MKMRQKHVPDFQPKFLRIHDVLVNVTLRIDDYRSPAFLISQKIRGMGQATEIILFKNHRSVCESSMTVVRGQPQTQGLFVPLAGSANATYIAPCGSFGVRALLAAITTYCRPSTE